jgi:FAD:protein FMN transferase
MRKRVRLIFPFLLTGLLMGILLTGCGNSDAAEIGEGSKIESGNANTEDSSGDQSSGDAEESSSESNQNASDDSATREIFAMDTYMTVTAYGESADAAVDAAEAEIERLDALLSTGTESSEVAQINANGGGTLSEDGSYLMKKSLELYELTDGAFDVSIYPVMDLWGFTTQNFKVPSDDELKSALSLVDASKINFDEKTGEVSFDKEGMEIDFGGIAKGYTSDQLCKIFEKYGIQSAMINLGGNVDVYGKKTDGSNWRVAIQSPTDDNGYIGVIETANKAVITSGGYERYFEEDGVTYHHIIDPSTGYPANSGLTSVTIICDDGTKADGLSTSLFIMGEEKAAEFWKKHSDEFDFVLLKEDGSLVISEGVEDCFTTNLETTVVKADE